MNIKYEKVTDALKRVVKVRNGLLLTFFAVVMTTAEASSYGISSSDRDAAGIIVNGKSVNVSLDPVKSETEQKIETAFYKLDFSDEEQDEYMPVFQRMTNSLRMINAEKVTADKNSDDKSLELVFLLKQGVLVSVDKTLDSATDKHALVTFVYQREVLFSDVMDMDRLAGCIQTIVDKLQIV
jgi:hypothetical protein